MLITYLLLSMLPLLFFANTALSTVSKYFVEERKKEYLSRANVISGNISSSNYLFDETKKFIFDNSIIETSHSEGYRIIVVDSSGTVVNDSNKSNANDQNLIGKTFLIPEVIEALDKKDVARQQENGNIYAAASITDDSGNCIGAVFISAVATDINSTMNDLGKHIYLLVLGVAVIITIVVFFVSQVFMDPIKDLMRVIKDMSEGHLDQRVPVNKYLHNEFSDLATACNNMADKLEKVDMSRQQFVSNVSHELKTPLSSIKVLTESVLLEPNLPKETYVEFLQDINSEIDRMTEVINDLLTLVRLDQKEVPVNFVPSSLNGIIEGIIKRLYPLAKKKNIELIYENIKSVVAEVDAMKLSLAISNLIENGIKYTPEGGSVRVSIDADHQNAFLIVSDTGIGMKEEELGRIFDRFYRVDRVRDRESGGTGLGLSITHSTVLMHKGSIKVTSKENEGTTFLVRIPLKQNN
ncbi:MAG: HAMP domain-containing sensor histidine kinase [Lachnospiraceae bacterium]|nr:HAMP domain-containing sensor histidine kinase [Lachnospiraceae bacterium]